MKEAGEIVAKQEAADDKVTAAAMANTVVSPVSPALAKKLDDAAAKEEKAASEEKAAAAAKEQVENNKLIADWKAAQKLLKKD